MYYKEGNYGYEDSKKCYSDYDKFYYSKKRKEFCKDYDEYDDGSEEYINYYCCKKCKDNSYDEYKKGYYDYEEDSCCEKRKDQCKDHEDKKKKHGYWECYCFWKEEKKKCKKYW